MAQVSGIEGHVTRKEVREQQRVAVPGVLVEDLPRELLSSGTKRGQAFDRMSDTWHPKPFHPSTSFFWQPEFHGCEVPCGGAAATKPARHDNHFAR